MENNTNILLVEDDFIIAMMEQEELENKGYTVYHVATGETAVKTILDTDINYDLILMDIDLGSGIDGTQAAKQILINKDIPIVFLSAHTETEVVEKTEKITSYGYVVKNSGIIVLDASIKMALKLFRSNQKLLASEEKFMKAFMYSPAPLSINDISNNNIYVDCNDAFIEMTGYTKEEVIGKNPLELKLYAEPEDRSKIIDLLKRYGEVKNYFHKFKNKNGEITEKLLSIVIIELKQKPYALCFQSNILSKKRRA